MMIPGAQTVSSITVARLISGCHDDRYIHGVTCADRVHVGLLTAISFIEETLAQCCFNVGLKATTVIPFIDHSDQSKFEATW